MIKVILADDHHVVRDGIKMLLNSGEEIKVIGEASDGHQVLGLIDSGLDPDIVISDLSMPVMDGFSLISKLKTERPSIKTMVLSVSDDENYVAQAFQNGCLGYLSKSVQPSELIFAIRHIHSGGRYLGADLSVKMVDRVMQEKKPELSPDITFTSRESEILQLIAQGCTNNEIAEKLFISRRTVEGHRQNLIEKTTSKNTAELIGFAFRYGLILN
ncbi:DNA-binding NarL/FixJ family response regulator [Pedobacter sp. W3I1]|uniref:response regulator n=1 Tax=Pedobacter sp. W3I1 TaxID=3042291 RepID=UPI00278B4CCB|nr:response regulator transcription factor [Pedobacter sp. W3I1]MDQ0637841.1 DNA-binding NarL/FixJ family response regulator [Pedobacter sp. W3I1]